MEKATEYVSFAEKEPRYEESLDDEPDAREVALQYNRNDHKDMYRVRLTRLSCP